MQPLRLRTGFQRTGTAMLLAGWWALLARVVHACFLRPPPRSLELTLQFLVDQPGPALALILSLGAGSALRIVLGSRNLLDALSLTTALVWLALILT